MSARPPAIRLFLFDVGKVLIDFDFNIAVRRLRAIGLDERRAAALFNDARLAESWDKGLMSEGEFFAILRRELGLTMAMEDFAAVWNGIFKEKEDAIALALSLQEKAPVVLLSNTNPWHAGHLRAAFPWIRRLGGFIASCEVRMMKPDPGIYLHAIGRAGVRPEETFYTDDIPGFVGAARGLGMRAHLFQGVDGLVRALKASDVPLP